MRASARAYALTAAAVALAVTAQPMPAAGGVDVDLATYMRGFMDRPNIQGGVPPPPGPPPGPPQQPPTTTTAVAATCCPERRAVSVSGVGTVRVTPDQATLGFHVTSLGDSPQEARVANEAVTADVLAALAAVGVPPADITVRSLTVTAHYVPVNPDDPSRGSRQSGYEASRYGSALLRNTSTLPYAVAAVTEAGGNDTTIDGVTLSLSEPAAAAAQSAALARAVASALLQARTIARSLGDALGDAVTVSAGGGVVPRSNEAMLRAPAADAGAGSTANPDAFTPEGQITVTQSVSAVFALLS